MQNSDRSIQQLNRNLKSMYKIVARSSLFCTIAKNLFLLTKWFEDTIVTYQ